MYICQTRSIQSGQHVDLSGHYGCAHHFVYLAGFYYLGPVCFFVFFCIFGDFLLFVLYVLSVPVQEIAWKDSSLK